MKIRYLICAASAALVAAFALYARKTTPPQQALLEPPAGNDQSGTAAAFRNDADVLSALSAINQHEIASAQLVQGKLPDGPLLQYARMLQARHSENQRLTEDLSRSNGVPISDLNAAVVQLKSRGQNARDELGDAEGLALRTRYLDAVISGHRAVLDLIDNDLLPAAARAEVDRHLRTTRDHVAAHLATAMTLKDNASAA